MNNLYAFICCSDECSHCFMWYFILEWLAHFCVGIERSLSPYNELKDFWCICPKIFKDDFDKHKCQQNLSSLTFTQRGYKFFWWETDNSIHNRPPHAYIVQNFIVQYFPLKETSLFWQYDAMKKKRVVI